MFCQLDRIQVFYETVGEGKPMVMLHGGSLDHRAMIGAMEPIFAKRDGWLRIYPDMPGSGKTKGEDWISSSDDMVDVLCEFIDTVLPDQTVTLCGWSYGGYIAQGIAHRMPERIDGMLLMCATFHGYSADRELPEHIILVQDEALMAELPAPARMLIEQGTTVQTAHILNRIRNEIMDGVYMADMTFLKRLREQYKLNFEGNDADYVFEKPALFVLGKQDAVVGYADAFAVHKQYPRGTLAVLDRAGHSVHLEQETLFNALVYDWLDRMDEFHDMTITNAHETMASQ